MSSLGTVAQISFRPCDLGVLGALPAVHDGHGEREAVGRDVLQVERLVEHRVLAGLDLRAGHFHLGRKKGDEKNAESRFTFPEPRTQNRSRDC